MNKKLLGALVAGAILFMGMMPQTVRAANTAATHVFGYVSDNGHPVEGALVYVICDSQGAYTDKRTDANGYYTIVLDNPPCLANAKIRVTAWGSTSSGDAVAIRHGLDNRIDVVLGANIPVPEYGLIGGVVAAGAGVGVIAIIRRRFLDQTE